MNYNWSKDNTLKAPESSSIMTVEFEVKSAGLYVIDVKGLREHNDGPCKDAANDACNDVFTQLDNTG